MTKKTTYLSENQSATTTEVTDVEERLISATSPENTTVRKTYTKGGDVATETDVFGKVTTYTYDPLGRLLTKVTPFEGSAVGKTTYTYDKVGNVLSETIEKGKVGGSAEANTTTYAYDNWGNVITTIQYDKDQPASYIQGYYDYKGQLIREYKGLYAPLNITGLDQVVPTKDTAFATTKYEYHYLGKISKTTNTIGQVETNRYDAEGNVLERTDTGGATYRATYNLLGQLVTEEKAATGKTAIRKTMTYDNMGKMTSITTNGEITNFTYNGKGELLKEQTGNLTKSFTYNLGGLLLTSQIKEGDVLQTETAKTYDLMGRLVTVADKNGVKATYTYDQGSQVIKVVHRNGLVEMTTYNHAGLPKVIINKDAKGKEISKYEYAYQVDGNQATKTEGGGVTTNTYDGLNRLTEEVYQKE